MALKDVVSATKPKAEGAPETKFVGIKLDYPDYQELCQMLGVSEGAGGAACFKAMLKEVIENRA